MTLTDCYLCGHPIEPDQARTGDHVVPTVLLGRKQPKVPGYDYAGRIPTHRTCNNHFSDETFFRQALHLILLILHGNTHGSLQNAQHPGITILPVTPDQVPAFVERDFRRFKFIDTRNTEIDQLKNPEFYADKLKTNLFKESMYAAMSVMAKSAAALLVMRKLHRVPRNWKIFASPHEAIDSWDTASVFNGTRPFDQHTRAAVHKSNQDEWFVAYQHKSLLMLFLFAFHDSDVDLRKTFAIPGSEIHGFFGDSLNDLLTLQWQLI